MARTDLPEWNWAREEPEAITTTIRFMSSTPPLIDINCGSRHGLSHLASTGLICWRRISGTLAIDLGSCHRILYRTGIWVKSREIIA
jgi:hypothetical protein